MFPLYINNEIKKKYYEESIKKEISTIKMQGFKKNVFELKIINSINAKGENILIKLTLPTFALKCESKIIIQIQQSIKKIFNKKKRIEFIVNCIVKPAFKQSLKKKHISNIKNIILISSGKGGVGKSTIASNLAVALSRFGCRVGLLDADIYGPSIPTLFNIKNEDIKGIQDITNKSSYMIPKEKNGIKLMSIGFLINKNSSIAWRGPISSSVCLQLFYNVLWGELDYLIVDLPPGTGDIQLTISQKISVAGSIVITTPQDIAINDVLRTITMFKKVNINILGYIKNMNHFVCTNCDHKHFIFPNNILQEALRSQNIDELGILPINKQLAKNSDKGIYRASESKNAIYSTFRNIAQLTATKIAQLAENKI